MLILYIHIFAATVAIFLTAIPLAIANNNLFLFLIAIFSFYLAFAGWRFARNVSGRPAAIDLLGGLLMLSSGLGMWALALIFYHTGDMQYVVLLLFGFIALALGITDLLSFQSGTVVGSKRLTRHLTNMFGGDDCGHYGFSRRQCRSWAERAGLADMGAVHCCHHAVYCVVEYTAQVKRLVGVAFNGEAG